MGAVDQGDANEFARLSLEEMELRMFGGVLPKTTHAVQRTDDCDPLEYACDGRCQGAGACPLNPLSELHNMPMDEYRLYRAKQADYQARLEAFAQTEEGQAWLDEMAAALKLPKRDRS